jgi:hypothetical protein
MAIAVGKTAAVGFVPVLLVVAVFGAYVAAATPTPVSSNSGLLLRVSVNSTNLRVGQELDVKVSLFNALPSQNEISIPRTPSSGGFEIQGYPIAMWGGCLFPEPIEFMIVKGQYSVGQLEDLSINSSSPPIICMEGGAVRTVVFQANSDVADLLGSFCTAECYPNEVYSVHLESNFTVNGYWGYPLNSSEAQDIYTPYGGCTTPSGNCGLAFSYPEVGPIAQSVFSPGEYTLLVEDVWGQVQLLYFTVT